MMRREVGASLQVSVTAPTVVDLQVAIASQPGLRVKESLSVKLDGAPVSVREIAGAHGTRIHSAGIGIGDLRVEYAATIEGRAQTLAVNDMDVPTYLRPSRYAEADKFFGFAAT